MLLLRAVREEMRVNVRVDGGKSRRPLIRIIYCLSFCLVTIVGFIWYHGYYALGLFYLQWDNRPKSIYLMCLSTLMSAGGRGIAPLVKLFSHVLPSWCR